MGTRGAIVRINGEHGFTGRYHHWDSYPAGLGASLFNLYHEHFKGDLPLMLHTLIDEHPAGWSTVNGKNFNLAPGFIERGSSETEQPLCYCHGERAESEQTIDEKNAADSGCEFVYLFTENRHMRILASYCEDGSKMIGMFGYGDPGARWAILADIDLDKPAPDWDTI